MIFRRQVSSSRLLFDSELGSFDDRVLVALPAPFRPHLSDPEAKFDNLLQRGVMVMGADPVIGVRPQHRTKGLHKQYRAPGSKKPGVDQLKDVIIELVHCRDHKIDVFITPSVSTHTQVMFEWKGFTTDRMYLIGGNRWVLMNTYFEMSVAFHFYCASQNSTAGNRKNSCRIGLFLAVKMFSLRTCRPASTDIATWSMGRKYATRTRRSVTSKLTDVYVYVFV